jgi:hypothetical protein
MQDGGMSDDITELADDGQSLMDEGRAVGVQADAGARADRLLYGQVRICPSRSCFVSLRGSSQLIATTASGLSNLLDTVQQHADTPPPPPPSHSEALTEALSVAHAAVRELASFGVDSDRAASPSDGEQTY